MQNLITSTKPTNSTITNTTYKTSIELKVDEFISSAFHTIPNDAIPLIFMKIGDPENINWKTGKSALINPIAKCSPNGNVYLNCSSFATDPDGCCAATEAHFSAFHFLILDDVGTKVARQAVAHLSPTWEVETSSGNSQLGFVLQAPTSDPNMVRRMQDAAISAGMCDPEATGIALWARLPFGVNGKAQYKDKEPGYQFRCRLLQWNPHLRFTAEELISKLSADVKVDALPNDGAHTELDVAGRTSIELVIGAAKVCNNFADGKSSTALTQYSLLGRMTDLAANVVDRTPIFGEIVLLGQATTIYAKPNTGKTLITLQMIIEGVKAQRFDPSKLYYINMDDDSRGLLDKGQIAQDYGFNMLADGYYGFEARKFAEAMVEMISDDKVNGAIVVLDTLKKFVDTMDKAKTRQFAGIVRAFVQKGGTVVALAHANKNPGANGKIVYSGTSDIVDDFDCIYTLADLPQKGGNQKVVVFENIKRRGNVPDKAAYSYVVQQDITYTELLSSVRAIDQEDWDYIEQTTETTADADVIAAIEACILEGITQKMLLRDAAAKRCKVSERQTIRVIEKYTGDDPLKHHWNYVVAARGAKVFTRSCPNPWCKSTARTG